MPYKRERKQIMQNNDVSNKTNITPADMQEYNQILAKIQEEVGDRKIDLKIGEDEENLRFYKSISLNEVREIIIDFAETCGKHLGIVPTYRLEFGDFMTEMRVEICELIVKVDEEILMDLGLI